MRIAFFIISGALLLIIFLLIILEVVIAQQTAPFLYSSSLKIPFNRVGLILGTARYLSNKRPNPYFFRRIDAAVELFKQKKVELFVVSGDNRTLHYNEPLAMKKELVRRGVPAEKIYFDFGGLSTYDSILRMKSVFQLKSFTIISQKFQNQRAVFIARHNELTVVAFNAPDIVLTKGLKTFIRERAARLKMLFDLLLQRKVQIPGPPEKI